MPVLDTTRAQVTAIPHVVDALCQVCDKCLARDVCRSKAILRIFTPAFYETHPRSVKQQGAP